MREVDIYLDNIKRKGALHNSMTKLCSAFSKYENKLKNWLRKITHSFEVHSNESACRKIGRLGPEQVTYVMYVMYVMYAMYVMYVLYVMYEIYTRYNKFVYCILYM